MKIINDLWVKGIYIVYGHYYFPPMLSSDYYYRYCESAQSLHGRQLYTFKSLPKDKLNDLYLWSFWVWAYIHFFLSIYEFQYQYCYLKQTICHSQLQISFCCFICKSFVVFKYNFFFEFQFKRHTMQVIEIYKQRERAKMY